MAQSQPQKENVTFRMDVETKKALDEIAEELQRDRSYVLNEAVTAYLDVYRWQYEETLKALKEADAGNFASDEEVAAVFAKWLPHES